MPRAIPSSNTLPELVRVFNLINGELGKLRSGSDGKQSAQTLSQKVFSNAQKPGYNGAMNDAITRLVFKRYDGTTPAIDDDGNCVLELK